MRQGSQIEYLRNQYHWLPLADPKLGQ